MSKRQSIDFAGITVDQAIPMSEAVSRTGASVGSSTKTAELQPLAFKVPPEFRKRFRQRALEANLKLNELLFATLDAWEEKHVLKK